MNYVIGVDVGTASVRAALVDEKGEILKTESTPIKIWNPAADVYQQSSRDIWTSVCGVVRRVAKDVPGNAIKGIGFDATCSLVVLDKFGNSISVYPGGEDDQNVVMWMDHRAHSEAELINGTGHPILKYVGGNVSLEMSLPKMLWLKKHHARCWEKAAHFMLLPDFLTWCATNSENRSLCSLVCKFNARSDTYNLWDENFMKSIGFDDLREENWRKIGSKGLIPGEMCGFVTEMAAQQLGLNPGTSVGVSLIDAHAGALGVIGCRAENVDGAFHTKLALICGTSTCHMTLSPREINVPGVWGPYYNAVLPNYWLLEGGQSVSGKLLDFLAENHPSTKEIIGKLGNRSIYKYLNDLLADLARKKGINLYELGKDLHVWPDFHGNRSPIADPTLKGMIVGLSLSTDEEDLAVLYLATIQALAYGTKMILEKILESGHDSIRSVLICGGLRKNGVFVETHADALGLPVLVSEERESVLLGAAMLGAAAAKLHPSVENTITAMAGVAASVQPRVDAAKYHERKYEVFRQMVQHQLQYKEIMNSC